METEMKLLDQEKSISEGGSRWEDNVGKYEQSDVYLGLSISGKNWLRRESQDETAYIMWPLRMCVWDCLDCVK